MKSQKLSKKLIYNSKKLWNNLIGGLLHAMDYGFLPKKNTIYTHIEYHLGDNISHLHYIKKVALLNPSLYFEHYLKPNYINELSPYIKGLHNVKILSLYKKPIYSQNAWKNYKNIWLLRNKDESFTDFYIRYFNELSKRLKIKNPIIYKEDFIFDNPVISKDGIFKKYDFLIVNSEPLSGQFNYSTEELNKLIADLSVKYSIITTKKLNGFDCTLDFGYGLNEIAIQSLYCKYHLMIATGPCWLVLNKTNCHKSSGIFLLGEEEVINFSNNMNTFASIKELKNALLNKKIL